MGLFCSCSVRLISAGQVDIQHWPVADMLDSRSLRNTGRQQYPVLGRFDRRSDWKQSAAAPVYQFMLRLLPRCQCLGLLPNFWRSIQSGRDNRHVPHWCPTLAPRRSALRLSAPWWDGVCRHRVMHVSWRAQRADFSWWWNFCRSGSFH